MNNSKGKQTTQNKAVCLKPKWLKKTFPNKPWKYKHTIQEGDKKGLVIEPYNFSTPIGMDFTEIEKAINWIDQKPKVKSSVRK